jgi:uncharacterized protein
MTKPFLFLYHYFEKHRVLFYCLFLAHFLLFGFFAIRIRPSEDISTMLPRDRQTAKLNDILQNAKFADKLVVMISMKDSTLKAPDSLLAFADEFAGRTRRELSHYIRSMEDQVNDSLFPALLALMQDHLPLYLTDADYAAVDSLISPGQLQRSLSQDVRTLSSPAGMVLGPMIRRDPVGITGLALQKIRQLQYDDNFELFDNHIVTRDGRWLLVFISPAYPPDNTGKNTILLNGLDRIIGSLETERLGRVQASYFGAVAVSAGNAVQLRKDSLLTLSITVLFLLLFIAWYFKRKSAPLLIMIPVVSGALFALAMIYLLKGTISVIALAAGSVVFGIAINYSLHVFNHFRHTGNIREVIRDLAFPLTIGSFTTIGGFFCLQFVRSEILKDLGLFAAFSLIGAAFSSLVFLPQLIRRKGTPASTKEVIREDSWIEKIARYHPERNRYIVIGMFALTILFGYTANRVRFDSDMMHMNFMPEALRQSEITLNRINAYSLRSVYLIADGASLDQALARNEQLGNKILRLQEQKVIRKYSGAFTLLFSDSLQRERIRRWDRFWSPGKKQQLLQALQETGRPLGFKETAFAGLAGMLDKSYMPLDATEKELVKKGFADDYIIAKPGQVSLITLLKVLPGDKQAVYDAFAGEPDASVIDRQFIAGKLVSIINLDFTQIAWMTSILVFVVMLITYGRIELTLISFIPMFIAFIWILGIMGIAGLEFNIVNIILSALIFGLGDDYSLFIMDGLLQEYRTGRRNLSSYKSSIVLSAITTLAGLGVLIFAKHPALRSIALISITGILCVVLIAQVLIPFLFNLMITNRVRKGRFPWTASGLLKSFFSFSYFAFGSMVMTVAGFLLIRLNPFNKEKGKYLFHLLLSKYTWSLVYIMGNVKKTILNPQQENFASPAVLIANHQSFLDIVIITMLHPKLVLVTNRWVWRSPVFGEIVRMADYYPATEGIENSVDRLAGRVREGYSIVVFPEGTRSSDGGIKRFHKGAFFLAEKLGLDILPVMIHGTSYAMSKGDFLLKDGRITIEYLPRIRPGDRRYGDNYTDRAKNIGRYFRETFARLRSEREQPVYFRELLYYNYVYKGPVLEWYLRIKVAVEHQYRLFHGLLPAEGTIVDIGCGYGFMSYMLHFAAPQRDITGFDFDEEKIEVAEHCFSRNDRIRFIHAEACAAQFEPADGIILSDVLHYLEPEKQSLLIQQCIDRLRPGGVLLIRDGDKDLGQQHRWTRLTEFFSTRFSGFNKTGGKGLFYFSGSSVRQIAARNKMDCRIVGQSKYTSNLIFVLTHAANEVL